MKANEINIRVTGKGFFMTSSLGEFRYEKRSSLVGELLDAIVDMEKMINTIKLHPEEFTYFQRKELEID